MRKDIDKIVKKLIKTHNTTNPSELAELLDIGIIEHDLKTAYGMYKLVNRNKFIFINIRLDDITKRFVIAHELGHAILHRKSPGFYFKNHTLIDTCVFENEANIFASELLIDNNELLEVLNYGWTIPQLASYFNVTSDLIKFKIYNLQKKD